MELEILQNFTKNIIELETGQEISRTKFLQNLVSSLYSRSADEFGRGMFRVRGDVTDVFPAYSDQAIRVHFFGDTIEEIETIDPGTGKAINSFAHMLEEDEEVQAFARYLRGEES